MPRVEGSSDLIDLAGELVHKTFHPNGEPKAYLIDFGDEEKWVPASIAELEMKKDNNCIVTVPEWFAYKQGLI